MFRSYHEFFNLEKNKSILWYFQMSVGFEVYHMWGVSAAEWILSLRH